MAFKFWRKLSLRKKKKRAATQPVPRQGAPIPYGENQFRLFMDPHFDRNSEDNLRWMAEALRQESFAAKTGANACRSPIARRPTRYLGVMPQPELPQPLSEADELDMNSIARTPSSDRSQSGGKTLCRRRTTLVCGSANLQHRARFDLLPTLEPRFLSSY